MDEELTLVFAGDLAPLRPLSDERDGPREVWEYLRSAELAMANLAKRSSRLGTSVEVGDDEAVVHL